jgi:hypothetical protein
VEELLHTYMPSKRMKRHDETSDTTPLAACQVHRHSNDRESPTPSCKVVRGA